MGLLFLSHSAADAELAGFVEDQIRRLVPDTDVFRTSRTGQIVPGDEWFQVITQKLREATSYLILVTPNSVERPWMWFEAGAGWMTSRPVLPVCVAIGKGEVPEPLSFFQIYSLEAADEAVAVFAKLGGALSEPEMFASAIARIAAGIREQVDAESGWEGIPLGRYFMAWDGPLNRYEIGQDIGTPNELIETLNKMGRRQTYALPMSMASAIVKGYRQVWAVDRKLKQRHALIEENGQVLLTRSESGVAGG